MKGGYGNYTITHVSYEARSEEEALNIARTEFEKNAPLQPDISFKIEKLER